MDKIVAKVHNSIITNGEVTLMADLEITTGVYKVKGIGDAFVHVIPVNLSDTTPTSTGKNLKRGYSKVQLVHDGETIICSSNAYASPKK